jgi:pimeloyl-ACP methyl ester carboxylesterase
MERIRQSYWYTGSAALGLWVLNVDSLARDRQVIAFDVLGFGCSSRPNFSSAAQEAEAKLVKSIELLANALGLVNFILLGHSMGGFLVSAYALQHADRVSHLVLADAWGFPNPTDQPGNDPAQLPTPFW